MRNFAVSEKSGDQGQYAELLHEVYALLHPRVREVFDPVLLQGAEAGSGSCDRELLECMLDSALESITWKLFETWAVILWDASEKSPDKILRLETLDPSMLPSGNFSAWFVKTEEEMDILTEGRIREVLSRLRKCFPLGTFLPPQMAELIRLEGNLAVTCH